MKGTLAESRIQDICSGLAETDIEFGTVVVRGHEPERGVRPYNGENSILGIALADPTKGIGPEAKYKAGDAVAVVRKGVVRVQAGVTSERIVAGMKLAVLKSPTVFPTTPVSVAARGSGNPPGWGETVKAAYTVVGPWGESALKGISETFNCTALGSALNITVPGKAAVPKGTTQLRVYISDDNGTTWLIWPAGIIPYEDLSDGPTHTVVATRENEDLGATTPPAEDPVLPAVGAILAETDPRDILVVPGTEVVKGGAAGQEIWVELNLPA